MYQLPSPPSQVSATTSFDSANTQALLSRLSHFLQGLEEHLQHPQPADLLPADHPEHAYLAGHLMLIGFQLLLVRRESPESLRLLQDAACTLNRFSLYAQEFTQATYDLCRAFGYTPAHTTHLTWDELPHAAQLLHQIAQHAGIPPHPTWQPGGLAHRLNPPSSMGVNPLCPPPLELCPPRTACRGHQAREVELLHLLPTTFQSPGDREEALATLLLLCLNARDQLTHLPVLTLLELTASLLLIARDERREAGASTTRLPLLLAHFQALRQEFGPLRLHALRPGTVIPRAARAHTVLATYSVLRTLRSQHETPLPRTQFVEQQLWKLFDRLDVTLAQGRTPDDEPTLFVLLHLTSLWALTHTNRAPGMPLPLVVDIGCQLADHDPLWAWHTLQGLPEPSDLYIALQSIVQCLQALGNDNLEPGEEEDLVDLVHQWGCQAFAVARQLNVRFPHHTRLEDLLLGPMQFRRQSLLQDHEYTALQQRFLKIADAVIAREAKQQAHQGDELAVTRSETTGAAPSHEPHTPEASETRALPWPAHILEARALLAGQHVTLLGGVPDPAHHAALVDTLALARLEWIPSARYDHGFHVPMAADTGLVILAIRWMGHAHNGLRDLARQRGIPCVMHPGGLNPSNIAYQVLKQVSRQLHASA